MSAIGSERAGSGGAAAGGRVVVVIEDEAIVLAGYQMLFESWGYVVVAAQSADEALQMLTATPLPPGFILADFRLRDGQTGTEAIERVRAAFGADIPGVVVTGDTTVTVERLRLAASEGMPILHKPVNGRQLQDMLTRSFKGA
ncbi:response regulator [Phaeospirillum tilakii]|uniref:Response regulator n=1 Tax=Phaeospirillum tilakii TaxID=741673 RepID=A0ABW5C6X6_9PROT